MLSAEEDKRVHFKEDEELNEGDLHDIDLEADTTLEEETETQAPTEAKEAEEEEDWTKWEERLHKEYGSLDEGKATTWTGYGIWGCLKVVNGMDFVGEVIIEFLGLNQSKYQYVIDAHNRHQDQLVRERKRAEREAKKVAEMEGAMLDKLEGGGNPDDNNNNNESPSPLTNQSSQKNDDVELTPMNSNPDGPVIQA